MPFVATQSSIVFRLPTLALRVAAQTASPFTGPTSFDDGLVVNAYTMVDQDVSKDDVSVGRRSLQSFRNRVARGPMFQKQRTQERSSIPFLAFGGLGESTVKDGGGVLSLQHQFHNVGSFSSDGSNKSLPIIGIRLD
ncbi:hypothetical protein HYQ46_011634 [Verticillium longisporum]|nr:hypothetical protein HYQ46_011634 [Verticillium longisporum]